MDPGDICPHCALSGVPGALCPEHAAKTELLVPCPNCTEIRGLYDRAWGLLCDSRDMRLQDETVPGDGSRVQCKRCRNRGQVLTAAGQQLVEFIKSWSSEEPEPF